MGKVPVITIDGLSGAGKGTVSKMLCNELGWNIFCLLYTSDAADE